MRVQAIEPEPCRELFGWWQTVAFRVFLAVYGVDEMLIGRERYCYMPTIGKIHPTHPFHCVDRGVEMWVYAV